MRRVIRLGAVVLASWPANRVKDARQGSVPTSPSGGNMNMRRILTVRSGLVVAAVLAVVAVAGCGEGAPAPTEASTISEATAAVVQPRCAVARNRDHSEGAATPARLP